MMPSISALLFTPGLLTWLGLGAVLGAIVIWWIIRKKEHRIWLPTIRILPNEQRTLPRLVVKKPPILFFLSFLGICLSFLFISTKPTSQVFKPYEPNQSKYLMFVDLSPSMSASVTLDEIATLVQKTCEHLFSRGKVYFSSSLSPHAQVMSTCDQPVLRDVDSFHRAGLRLGEAVKSLLSKNQDFDQMYIISDQNQHTWVGFNWAYMKDEVEVFFINVQKPIDQNVSINDAKMISQIFPSNQAKLSTWDIELLRTRDDVETEGIVQVFERNTLVKEQNFDFPPGKRRMTTRIEWVPQEIAPNPDARQDRPEAIQDSKERFVEFKILVQGDRLKSNGIVLDDVFKATYHERRQVVSLIGENSGEQTLEDPMAPLQTSLETLGFMVEKKDFIESSSSPIDPSTLDIYAGGMGAVAERFCARMTSGRKEFSKEATPLPRQKIWLLPLTDTIDFYEMCRCLHGLFPQKSRFDLAACQHVHTPKDWTTLLPSVGGKQLGGELGSSSRTVGFFFNFQDTVADQNSEPHHDILALTLPFAARTGAGQDRGIGIAATPLLVRDLLTWHGVYDRKDQNKKNSWPRIIDIANQLWDGPDIAQKALDSNVAQGESELSLMGLAELPAPFNPLRLQSIRSAPLKRDLEDPLPWIKGTVIVLLAITLFEVILWTALFLTRLTRLRSKTTILFLIACLPLIHGQRGLARVDFGVVGSNNGILTTKQLAREVASRTSIELTAQPKLFARTNLEAFELPWLWVVNPSGLFEDQNRLPRDMVFWIKRGGFLIIETKEPTQRLNELTAHLGTSSTPSQGDYSWLPLPPDHELMRSFYLLDALPDCQGEIWRGLQFDGRLAVLAVPYGFLDSLKDQNVRPHCGRPIDQERSLRIFVNLIMVALATDYKKDQIHLPEILKRLR